MKNFFLIFSMLFFSLNSHLQNPCEELLRDGLYAHIKEVTNYSDFSSAHSAVCAAYQEYKQSKDFGTASVKYKKIFKGDATYTKEDIEYIGEMYCGSSSSINDTKNFAERYRSFIDPNLRDMYLACLDANTDGIKFSIKPVAPNDYSSIAISVSQNSTVSDIRRYKILELNCDKTKLALSGKLVDAAAKQVPLNNSYSLIAKRLDVKNTPYMEGGEMLLASAHQLIIQFESKSIFVNFPKIYPKVELKKGLGEIVASMLSEADFLNTYGKSEWMLANGQSVPGGSAYSKFIGQRVPDLRGVYLRGKNYDRDINSGNSSGNLDLGTYQKDMYFSHSHTVTDPGHAHEYLGDNYARSFQHTKLGGNYDADSSDGKGDGGIFLVKSSPSNVSINNNGGAETMPRSVTVNYFIKIN